MSATEQIVEHRSIDRVENERANRRALARWVAFNAVGLGGMALQLAVVASLVHLVHWPYLVATATGVEAAVLHNFAWHQRWTWRDRPARSRRATIDRLMRFHLLNGVISLAGNIGLTAGGTRMLHLDPVLANALAIGLCSLVNFAASESLVFSTPGRRKYSRTALVPLALLIMLAFSPAAEAGPGPSTVAGWRAYEARVEAPFNAASASGGSGFFVLDRDAQAAGWRNSVRHGQPTVIKIDAPSVDDGKIHHWAGAIFVPGMTVDTLVNRLEQQAGRESEAYEDVLSSRLIQRHGDRLQVFLKLRRTNLITVTYNTEHAVEYRRLGTRGTARSIATKIAELANAGTPQEHEKPPDDDNGFLWRLNAYWRYEAVEGGVLVECESVSLSRSVPLLIRPVANPIVDRIARESLTRTLTSLRAALGEKSGL
jgi:putative flippase GtrA